jgi:hypothetical protein
MRSQPTSLLATVVHILSINYIEVGFSEKRDYSHLGNVG